LISEHPERASAAAVAIRRAIGLRHPERRGGGLIDMRSVAIKPDLQPFTDNGGALLPIFRPGKQLGPEYLALVASAPPLR